MEKQPKFVRPNAALEMVGKKFGSMTVTSYAGRDNHKGHLVNVQCQCGLRAVKVCKDLRRTRGSRGCSHACSLSKQAVSIANTTHGMTKHPAFAVWRSMIDRCRLPSHQAWKNYGGRGITVCPRWQQSFENFWEDMGETYQKGLTLDRTDNNKGYSPENCAWVSHRTNACNKRNTAISEALFKKAECLGIGRSTLYYRMKIAKWPEDQWLRPPEFTNRVQ